MNCPFCKINSVILETPLFKVIRDKYPVAPGHTLIIPKRHAVTYFDLTGEEVDELWRTVGEIKVALDNEFEPDGYNVGFNVGETAGQTVMHCHIHIIPRYRGDMEDPRGGVRGVIPDKQKY